MGSMSDKSETADILDRMRDSHKQATEERSHYYTATVLNDAMDEVSALRATLLRIIWGCDELQIGGATRSGAWAAEIAKDAVYRRGRAP